MKRLNRTTELMVAMLVLIAIVGGILLWLRGDEDDWRCVDNKWQAHGKPFAPEPDKPCGTNSTGLIRVESPRPMSEAHNPLRVRGRAGIDWFSESGLHMVLVDWDGVIVTEGYAPKGAPAGDNLYSFEATLNYPKPQYSDRATLILQKSATSSGDSVLDIPVTLDR